MSGSLDLTNAQGFMRKISINVLAQDAENTLFTIPIEGIVLKRDELNAYMGDRTFESWFNQRKDGVWEPMPWVSRLPDGTITLDEKFETDGVELLASGKKSLVFKPIEAENEEDEDEPAGRIAAIKLTPRMGGDTLLAFHLQVRPGLGPDNIALQRAQYRHITLTLGELEEISRKTKQGELGFAPPVGAGADPKPKLDDEDDEDDEARTRSRSSSKNGGRAPANHRT